MHYRLLKSELRNIVNLKLQSRSKIIGVVFYKCYAIYVKDYCMNKVG